MGKHRTFSICLTDIPKDKIITAGNGKKYLPLQIFDFDQPDSHDNDFSVAISLNKDELEAKKNGQEIKKVFLGNYCKIWPDKTPTQNDNQQ